MGQRQQPQGCCQPCRVGREGQQSSGQGPQETPSNSQVKLLLFFTLCYPATLDLIFQPERCRKVCDVPWQLAYVLLYLKISSLFHFPARLAALQGSLSSGTLGGNWWAGEGMREGKMFQLNRLRGNQGRDRQYFSMLVLISPFFSLVFEIIKRKSCAPYPFLVGCSDKSRTPGGFCSWCRAMMLCNPQPVISWDVDQKPQIHKSVSNLPGACKVLL